MVRQVGKIGKRNIDANKKIKEMFEDREIYYCEIRLPGCMINNFLQFCHRHKREYYRSLPELLYAFEQVVLGCQNCHQKIEPNRTLTEKVFMRLRGKEKGIDKGKL